MQEEITDMFDIQWADNVKSRYVNVEPINQYRKTDSDKPVRSQIEIYKYLKKRHGYGWRDRIIEVLGLQISI